MALSSEQPLCTLRSTATRSIKRAYAAKLKPSKRQILVWPSGILLGILFALVGDAILTGKAGPKR